MQEMNDVDIHLDGYSDRRGDEASNLALSNQRLASVRNALVQAGVDGSSIHINARGDQEFNSTPGNLVAYTFDRRVVIRFEQSAAASSAPVALTDQEPTI
jgi:outer membrane protein OmpA-like peptidoglycan-associated protein